MNRSRAILIVVAFAALAGACGSGSGSVPESKVQVRAMEVGTHVPLGEFRTLAAARKNVKGFVQGFFIVFWNVEKL